MQNFLVKIDFIGVRILENQNESVIPKIYKWFLGSFAKNCSLNRLTAHNEIFFYLFFVDSWADNEFFLGSYLKSLPIQRKSFLLGTKNINLLAKKGKL